MTEEEKAICAYRLGWFYIVGLNSGVRLDRPKGRRHISQTNAKRKGEEEPEGEEDMLELPNWQVDYSFAMLLPRRRHSDPFETCKPNSHCIKILAIVESLARAGEPQALMILQNLSWRGWHNYPPPPLSSSPFPFPPLTSRLSRTCVSSSRFQNAFTFAENSYGRRLTLRGPPEKEILLRRQVIVGQDNIRARRLWEEAAELGHTEAQRHLSQLLLHQGKITEAVAWARAAAAQGENRALIRLGVYYIVGSTRDPANAVIYLREAAAAASEGDSQALAQRTLARFYLHRDNPLRDLKEAEHWYELAINNHDEISRAELNTLKTGVFR